MSEIATNIASSDYESLIKQGILDAKGSIEEALPLLNTEDLVALGRTLVERVAHITNLFSIVVYPINNFAEGMEKGNYDDVNCLVCNEYLHKPLEDVASSKRIYVVPVTEDVVYGQEEAVVQKYGLTLCKIAPNYLLGLFAAVPESEIQKSLKGIDIVAVEHSPTSVFLDKDGDNCFLYRFCYGETQRDLDLLFIKEDWPEKERWAFLAEKPHRVGS